MGGLVEWEGWRSGRVGGGRRVGGTCGGRVGVGEESKWRSGRVGGGIRSVGAGVGGRG